MVGREEEGLRVGRCCWLADCERSPSLTQTHILAHLFSHSPRDPFFISWVFPETQRRYDVRHVNGGRTGVYLGRIGTGFVAWLGELCRGGVKEHCLAGGRGLVVVEEGVGGCSALSCEFLARS